MPLFAKNQGFSNESNIITVKKNAIVLDLMDDDDFYYVYAEFPGREKNEIKIRFIGDHLCLKVIDTDIDSYTSMDKNYVIGERFLDEKERLISFGETINKKNVSANFKNGLLEIIIPKLSPEDDNDGLIDIT